MVLLAGISCANATHFYESIIALGIKYECSLSLIRLMELSLRRWVDELAVSQFKMVVWVRVLSRYFGPKCSFKGRLGEGGGSNWRA